MFLLQIWGFRITYPIENYCKEVFHIFWILCNIEQSNRIIKSQKFPHIFQLTSQTIWPPYRRSLMYDVTSHWQLWLNDWFAWRHPLPPDTNTRFHFSKYYQFIPGGSKFETFRNHLISNFHSTVYCNVLLPSALSIYASLPPPPRVCGSNTLCDCPCSISHLSQ